MPAEIALPSDQAAARATRGVCPVCRQEPPPPGLLGAAGLSEAIVLLVAANMPGWRPALGLCGECVRRFTRAHAYLLAHHPGFATSAHPILPTALRLGALERHRGRGVTIAFLDSGFHAHPDLVLPRDRILRYVDVTSPRAHREDLERPEESAWHGMMTSVVACGNGRLSGGFYRGLASEASVVLVKCGSIRRIAHDDIRRGFEWVLRNRKRYGIRIVNVSCGGDYEASYLTDGLSRAAERASREGILVCAAVGNLGHTPQHAVLPPASAPSVLTVGGLDDKNRLAFSGYDIYHSSYGPTLDGLQKPELIAPGIWVAAPILPGTATAAQARLLMSLGRAEDGTLAAILASERGVDGVLDAAAGQGAALLRKIVDARAREANLISEHYKHVDGTSFASPIVAAIAAQMLEANPRLTPQEVKRILIRTARRLPGVEVDRQGWGVVDPEAAVQAAVRTVKTAPRAGSRRGR